MMKIDLSETPKKETLRLKLSTRLETDNDKIQVLAKRVMLDGKEEYLIEKKC